MTKNALWSGEGNVGGGINETETRKKVEIQVILNFYMLKFNIDKRAKAAIPYTLVTGNINVKGCW